MPGRRCFLIFAAGAPRPGGILLFDAIMKLLVKDYDQPERRDVREKAGKAAGLVGIATNLVLFAIKLAAGLLAGSMAILADAVNNLTDSGSSIVMLVGFKLAGKPADEKHPFGHARMEYLSGVIVSFVVLFLGLELGRSSVEKILHPEAADFSALALGILAASVLIKLWQCFFYRSVGKKIASETVFATSSDSRNDAIATTVVLLGAVITRFSGVNLDGWLGLMVAVFIVISGVRLVMDTGNPLLGEAPDPELVRSICEKILAYDGVIGLHDLTVHNYGVGRCFASVHCEVPAERDILESHDLIDNIEREFKERENIDLVIHLDPVVTDDPRANRLHQQVLERVEALYPQVSVHDFRVVWGKSRCKILFDVAAPFSLTDTDEQIRGKILHELRQIDPTCRVVINVDRTAGNEL